MASTFHGASGSVKMLREYWWFERLKSVGRFDPRELSSRTEFDGHYGSLSLSDRLKVQGSIEERTESVLAVPDIREKFESWGIAPRVDKCVHAVIEESGFDFRPKQEGTSWTVEIKPKSNSEFDLTRAQKALHGVELLISVGSWGGFDAPKATRALAERLCTAARNSLEKHGDLRDAVVEMRDYEARYWNHPNAGDRDNLLRVLNAYVNASETYNYGIDQDVERAGNWEWFTFHSLTFGKLASDYLAVPSAHTRWLTEEISALLLRPRLESLAYDSLIPFSLAHSRFLNGLLRGLQVRLSWRIVASLCVSALIFALCVVFTIGSYLYLAPWTGYGFGALCGLMYASRYLQSRDFESQAKKRDRVWHRVFELYTEIKSGNYNAREVVRRFRKLEKDDLWLPSIFVNVVQLADFKDTPGSAVPHKADE